MKLLGVDEASTRTGDDADSGRGLLGRQRNVLLEATEIEIWLVLPEGEVGLLSVIDEPQISSQCVGPVSPRGTLGVPPGPDIECLCALCGILCGSGL